MQYAVDTQYTVGMQYTVGTQYTVGVSAIMINLEISIRIKDYKKLRFRSQIISEMVAKVVQTGSKVKP